MHKIIPGDRILSSIDDVEYIVKRLSYEHGRRTTTIAQASLHRYTAFASSPDGDNPTGIWIADVLPDSGTMQRVAVEVGFSETAFVAPAVGPDRTVRYYSPEAEVSFCGHATIATGVDPR